MDQGRLWQLMLPLALAQAVFFLAPLLLLAATSFATDENLREWSLRAWRDVLGDSFHIQAVLNTLRAVIKDTRLKEQAHLIQAEVRKLLEDMARLDERVTALGKHFAQATDDVRKIQITTDKLTKTGQRIDELELDDEQGKLEGN